MFQCLRDLGWADSSAFSFKSKKPEAKATTKQAAKKPVPKPKATKKAALVDRDDNAGSDVEMSSDGGAEASNRTQAAPGGSKKTASEKYTKVRVSFLHSLRG
jgi:hypothetical protein